LHGSGRSSNRIEHEVGAKSLHIQDLEISDLTPLKNLEPKALLWSPDKINIGVFLVRNMNSLEKIGITTVP
jgi:hypothetical protein